MRILLAGVLLLISVAALGQSITASDEPLPLVKPKAAAPTPAPESNAAPAKKHKRVKRVETTPTPKSVAIPENSTAPSTAPARQLPAAATAEPPLPNAPERDSTALIVLLIAGVVALGVTTFPLRRR